MPFANTFWSADYVSGIERLAAQSQLSLGQLHELRSLVFSYMKTFHSSGEALSSLWASAYPHDSSFRVSRGQRSDRKGSRRVVSRGAPAIGSSGMSSGINPGSPGSPGSSGIGSGSSLQVLSYDVPDEAHDLDFVFRQCVNNTNSHSGHFQTLASEIDASVLAPLTAFLKAREPPVGAAVRDLQQAYHQYATAYSALDAVLQQYTTTARLGDFPAERAEKPEKEESAPGPEPRPASPEAAALDFPLAVPGVVVFETRADLAVFLQNIISSVPITKRKISLPGYSNDIFCAEHLCDSFMRKRPKGFNPTRSNTEKLGQALLDWKLIVGTGFFAKKFASGNMWFQWSDSAVQLSLNSEARPRATAETGNHDPETGNHDPEAGPEKAEAAAADDVKSYLDDLSHLSLSTSKRFSGVLKSMGAFGKHQYSEQQLEQLERRYNECYDTFHRQRHLLETQLSRSAQHLEAFEQAKISLVYDTLQRLQQLVQTHLERAAGSARNQAEEMAGCNTAEARAAEFRKTADHFSSGVYFPALLVPAPAAVRPAAASNIQNIRLSFNLFKDVPLQLGSGHEQQIRRSTPLFLLEAVRLVESHSHADVAHQWTQPLSLERYWQAKTDVVQLIQNFELDAAVSVHNEAAVEAQLVHACIQRIGQLDVAGQVNFLQNWLLELGDSVIPSTVYDSLVSAYKLSGDNMADTLRILGTIPRANLSSLVLILEHICTVFGADEIQGQDAKDNKSEKHSENDFKSEKHSENDFKSEKHSEHDSKSEDSKDSKSEDSKGYKSEDSKGYKSEDSKGYKSEDSKGYKSEDSKNGLSIAEQLNSMDMVGAVPFMHTIMRPSPVKHKNGFKPPIAEYNRMLSTLLRPDCRQALVQTLLANEEQSMQRQQQQKQALQQQKQALESQRQAEQQKRHSALREHAPNPHLAVTPAAGGDKPDPRPADGDNFSLRPFRTGTTPRPSPATSPVNRARSRSMEFTALPKTVITPLDLNFPE